MTKISTETVDRIAHLARLEFPDEQKALMVDKMNKMLAFVDKLNELDTENVEPLVYMCGEVNALREDEVTETITQKEALQNAPKKDSDFFKVPKVLDRNKS